MERERRWKGEKVGREGRGREWVSLAITPHLLHSLSTPLSIPLLNVASMPLLRPRVSKSQGQPHLDDPCVMQRGARRREIMGRGGADGEGRGEWGKRLWRR